MRGLLAGAMPGGSDDLIQMLAVLAADREFVLIAGGAEQLAGEPVAAIDQVASDAGRQGFVSDDAAGLGSWGRGERGVHWFAFSLSVAYYVRCHNYSNESASYGKWHNANFGEILGN